MIRAGLLVLALAPGAAFAQAAPAVVDSTAGTTPIAPDEPPLPPPPSRDAWYGGSFAVTVYDGDVRVAVAPNLAFRLAPRLAGGVSASYEFVDYGGGGPVVHNYGGSVFLRRRFGTTFYAHSEYEARSLGNVAVAPGVVGRETVEFFWLGGGAWTSLGKRTAGYFEILFDLVQDPLSPYENGRPLTRVGVSFFY